MSDWLIRLTAEMSDIALPSSDSPSKSINLATGDMSDIALVPSLIPCFELR